MFFNIKALIMALTSTFAKLNDNQFADAVRISALNLRDTAQAKLEQAQFDGRSVLAKRVLVSAQHANQFSEFLTGLAAKIAPAPAPKAKPRKAAVKAAPKAKAAVAKAAPKAKRPAAKKAAVAVEAVAA